MSDKEQTYADFVVHTAVYKTKLTKKFTERKAWEKKDEDLVRAFIPGTVKEILVKPGDKVEENQPLLILEAMKMNTLIRSHRVATVKNIAVESGEKAKKGQLLAELA